MIGHIRFRIAGLAALLILACWSLPARAEEDLVQTILALVADKDRDTRHVGLEQVRDGVKGTEATQRFAAALPKLPPEAQVGLLHALADRGDPAAKPAVIAMISPQPTEVGSAATLALGALGDTCDVARLLELLAAPATQKDAAAALLQLRGDTVNQALWTAAKNATPAVQVQVLGVLTTRYATECVPALLETAAGSEPAARTAVFDALGQLAAGEHVAQLVPLALKASNAAARAEAEKAIVLVCQRIPQADQQAAPLLAAMDHCCEIDRITLLPTLGRIGGPKALALVDKLLKDPDVRRQKTALRALCNWPDGAIAPRLYEIARSASEKSVREEALDALVRVAPLPDKRPDSQRLDMLQKAMALSQSDPQKLLILRRARAIRSLGTLRFVAPYLDQPAFAQVACETVVELAHHKNVRQPNKAEFHKVLDKVIVTSKNQTVVERAKCYQEDRTWTEKQQAGKATK